MTRWRARASAKVALGFVAAAALLAACGVPADDGPQPVDSDIARLLEPQPSPTATATTEPRWITVTWVRGDSLARAQRAGVAETRQEVLDVAFAALLDGPRPAEQIKGSTTLLPPDLQLSGDVRKRRVVIELTVDSGLEPVGLPLAVGQVAVTALVIPRVQAVVFSVDGVPTSIPLPDNRGDARVVRLADYQGVLLN
ncbi:MAG: GerMN domain-containing protein [Actinomycetes bacterium]